MPTYSYACDLCNNNWEIEQKITEEATKTCPTCKKESARRLIEKPSFILRGGGWYSDGYSKKY